MPLIEKYDLVIEKYDEMVEKFWELGPVKRVFLMWVDFKEKFWNSTFGIKLTTLYDDIHPVSSITESSSIMAHGVYSTYSLERAYLLHNVEAKRTGYFVKSDVPQVTGDSKTKKWVTYMLNPATLNNLKNNMKLKQFALSRSYQPCSLIKVPGVNKAYKQCNGQDNCSIV